MFQVTDSGLVGSTDSHSSHPQEHGRVAARAGDAQGSPIQSHISPSKLVYEGNAPIPYRGGRFMFQVIAAMVGDNVGT